ncbi:MAG TPA: MBL fold metallo-hydrolase [Anaerolineae bacterium]|nr:MBL fold metallo-hydrolase [Anaerolineae bacterium]
MSFKNPKREIMQLTVLGAGTCLPVAEHSASGYLIRVNDTPLLFDAGPGTLARLNAADVSYRDLEYVFITHLHSDHTLDLVTLLQALAATPGWTREKTLHITGCRGLDDFLRALMQTYNGIAPRGYELIVSEIVEERREFPSWTIESALTGHTQNSIAYRVETNGRTLVYSGDASVNGNLVRLACDADVFVCECSLPEGWVKKDHLTARQVGRIAYAARVKKLVLTHLYPPALEADVVAQVRTEFAGVIIQARDGLLLEI